MGLDGKLLRRHPGEVRALLAAACLTLAVGARGSTPAPSALRAGSLDSALQDAARAKLQFVLAAVSTEGCGPCREMELTTWRDPAVAGFLKGRGLAVGVDGGAAFCRRRRVYAFPTVLILRPDGSELGRLVGYYSSADLISGIQDDLAGGTSVGRMRAKAAAAKTPGAYVQARFDLAQALMDSGRDQDALADLLWLYDDGMKREREFSGVRSSYLPAILNSLARGYPPAKSALDRRFCQARQNLLSPYFTTDDARDWLALSRWLAKPDADLVLFDSLPARDARRRVLAPMMFDDFLDKRRYSDAAASRSLKSAEGEFARCASEYWGKNSAKDAERLHMMREFCVEQAASAAEAYAGAGRGADARAVLARVRRVDDAPWIEEILRRHLRRAGHANPSAGMSS